MKPALLSSCLWIALALALALAQHEHLRLHAVVSRADGSAGFQCWEMAAPFTQYPTTGQAIPEFARVSNVSYVVLPARSSEGIHNPPHSMFFALLSGQAHITLPRGGDELWVTAGDADALIIADDVAGEGHITEYPMDRPSVALQIPFSGGRAPAHRVLHEGPCSRRETASSRHNMKDGGTRHELRAQE
ncbi:hypothetical protein JDV02_010597 [Purpureocillium takamizusanense]|uniref:Cupin type-1 domain-containing protein n=1 Tax=Purpureocillium takamizusanense TaxID=2060973 RepID=A0A9Q8QSK6_9HYPO|nr:uncharacterized protein JDV02_010597 [Purpureocillium takamizusanense]UNI24878.1 hypothetical protein JDV02_010597 [Purpureocillium takamizusanense]